MIVLLILIVLLLGIISAALYTYLVAFHASDKQKQKPVLPPSGPAYDPYYTQMCALMDELDAIAYEPISISADDGTVLRGRYYHCADHAPLQIQFHGYRGSILRDFCGGSKLARESGHNILLVDQRAHGDSGGHCITFGLLERQDCLCWANYAAARFPGTPIFLSGVSMGAATVLMASSLPLPEQVVGIMADCPFTSPADIIRKVAKDMGFPPKLAFPFIRLGAKLFGHFTLSEEGAVDAVRHAKLPILLIHGEEDDFVPCDMSRRIADACGAPLTFATFPHAGHGMSFLADPERYKALMDQFVAACTQ